jgi:serine phosphatase RsbU (regulator of sigma subunit)
LYYAELILLTLALIAAVTLFFRSTMRSFRHLPSRFFSVTAIIMAGICVLHLLLILNIFPYKQLLLAKFYFSGLMLLFIFYVHLIMLYPRGTVYTLNTILEILISLPGFAIIGAIFISDSIISGISLTPTLTWQKTRYSDIITIAIAFYGIMNALILIVKAIIAEERVIRRELMYYTAGTLFSFTLLFLTFYMWQILPGHEKYSVNFISVPLTLQLIISAYAVSDIRSIDFKSFYLRIIYWLLLFSLLAGPLTAGMFYAKSLLKSDLTAATIITVAIIMYLFFTYRFLQPRVENLFNREFLNAAVKLKKFFQSGNEIIISDIQEVMWENFYQNSIANFKTTFDISHAFLFIFDKEKNKYIYNFGYGRKPQNLSIDTDDSIVRCVEEYNHPFDRFLLYSDTQYQGYRDAVIEFYNSNNIDLSIPLYNHEHHLFALLFLGRLPGNRVYSKAFISALDLYRIQFQRQLANRITIEEARSIQIENHDTLVVDSVKEHTLPSKLHSVPGYRSSCFFIDHSKKGGDFFNSVRLRNGGAAHFISDTSYTGIDSALLGLELYAVLKSNTGTDASSQAIMNQMNWVLATGKLSSKYAPACCVSCAPDSPLYLTNAGYSGITLFNASSKTFTEIDSDNVPLGANIDSHYEHRILNLEKDDILIISSDGFSAAINEQGESFGLKKTREIIMKHPEESPAALARRIYEGYNTFIGGHTQINDTAVILIKKA